MQRAPCNFKITVLNFARKLQALNLRPSLFREITFQALREETHVNSNSAHTKGNCAACPPLSGLPQVYS